MDILTVKNDEKPVVQLESGLTGRADSMEAVAKFLPTFRVLSRTDKLRVVQYLISELVREEEADLLPGMSYPVWSPYDAYEAAGTLLKALEEDKK